jgi:hypothetical protein
MRTSETSYDKLQAIRSVRDRTALLRCYDGSIDLTGNQIRQDLRNWLSPPDPSINFNTASDSRHEGTALWFLHGNTFTDWKLSGSLLWLYGKRTSLYFTSFAVANRLSPP